MSESIRMFFNIYLIVCLSLQIVLLFADNEHGIKKALSLAVIFMCISIVFIELIVFDSIVYAVSWTLISLLRIYQYKLQYKSYRKGE